MALFRFSKAAFLYAGIGMITGAIFHLACLIGGPKWVAFAGAPEWAVESIREGTWIGYAVTLLITAILTFWAIYAFSGAGKIKKLPFLKTIIGITAFMLISRGLIILPLLPRWNWGSPFYIFHGVLSFYVLSLGVAYAIGLYGLIKEQA